MTVARVLVIAGSDSGGGAGIQADIKTVMALGGHATTAITAITAQNTLGVTRAEILSPDLVVAQIDAVLSDIGTDAIKIGMIGSAAIADAVADRLAAADARVPLLFDPVMIATSGAMLADHATIAAFDRLMAAATLVTPNLPELAALAGVAIERLDDDTAIVEVATALSRRIGAPLLVKGGHAGSAILVDRLVGADGVTAEWRGERIDSVHTHGTGCTLASAIATRLAAGDEIRVAIGIAREHVRQAIAAAPGIGSGAGPLGHHIMGNGRTALRSVMDADQVGVHRDTRIKPFNGYGMKG